MFLQVADRFAFERILESAAIHDRRALHRLQHAQPVAHRKALGAGIEVDVDAAEPDRVDRAVKFAQRCDGAVERPVESDAANVEGLAKPYGLYPVIARRRSQADRDDFLHCAAGRGRFCSMAFAWPLVARSARAARASIRVVAIFSSVTGLSNARIPAKTKPCLAANCSISRTLWMLIPRPSEKFSMRFSSARIMVSDMHASATASGRPKSKLKFGSPGTRMFPPSVTSTSGRSDATRRETSCGKETSHTTAPGRRSSGSTMHVVAAVAVSTISALRTAAPTSVVQSSTAVTCGCIAWRKFFRRGALRAASVRCATLFPKICAHADPMLPVAPMTAALASARAMSISRAPRNRL